MGRKPIDADRRQKIVDATLTCIHRFGFQETTVARICDEAGLSTGNVHYYFGGKQNLLEEAMRSLLRTIRGKMVASLNASTDPVSRLDAILGSNFHPEIFRPEICITWLHFWAQAPHDPTLARLERVNRMRFRNNLLHEIRKLRPPEQALDIARQTVAMVDGLWIEKAQIGAELPAEKAHAMVMQYAASQTQ
ncbi:transcriptional regulator BetI [Hwanghaeella grinnelliae]|uniref:HTH-type transcriptional regulator BetI n=1 Tax=Hwanghaeella grinnelliae TaxID=2500179 RepID=A0A437QTA1_9PROT|nr:transcriptional regulator BetI [Hwanghaeella grinnelliae]RVU37731.1 transcriptional regulator BetI [Hwanghaeella grinnelliae]